MVDIAAASNLQENLDHPIAVAMYMVSFTHCVTVLLAQGGEGIGSMWGEQKARELLADAGFTDVSVTRVDGDIANAHYLCRAG